MNKLKQVILIRNDITMSRGKLATQAAHASVLAFCKTPQEIIKEWEEQGMTKIVLAVDNLTELNNLIKEAENNNLTALTVEDDGLTEFKEVIVTCGVIGPNASDDIDKITSKLKLFH